MAIANNKDLTHVVRTTQQWQSSYDKYECIPEGVLCIEFTTSGQALAKIGNGRDIFSKLPYIGGTDLTNYFTKNETVKCIEDIIKTKRFICIKGILQNKDQLPSHAECGDLYFVISQNQSSSNKYDEYVYSPSNTWENLGSIPIDIDLSEYAKIVYVDEKIDEVNERIDDIEQHGTHTHANKDILDLITAAFTAEEKDKLSTLYNYDDTELRELITQASHTHSNKDILDAISAPFTKEDKSKLDQLNPYDDSILKEKIQALERLAHEHSNKRILDRTTASFTTEYERKMRWIRLYTGCTGMEEGIAGLVPAAQAGEEDYVLSGSGEWVPQTGGGGTYELPIATASTLGGIKVGDGLEIDANGKLSVVGSGGGGDSIAEGDGITITTDPQTGVKTISVNTGDNLEVDPNTGELNVTGVDYEAGQGIRIGSNYNFLEYIKNSGNYDQIILTDILPTFDDIIEVDVKFGAITDIAHNRPYLGVIANGASTPYLYALYTNIPSNSDTSLAFYNHFVWTPQNTSRNFIINPNGLDPTGVNSVRQIARMQGTDASWGNATAEFSVEYRSDYIDPIEPIAIFGTHNPVSQSTLTPYTESEMTLYGVKFYDSLGTLIHDLRPVERISNGEAGLYDVLTNKFYGNAGNGSFVKGPVITAPDRIINTKIGNGLQFDSNNAIEVSTGDGLQINQDGEVEIDPSIIPEVTEYEAGTAISIEDVEHGGVTFDAWDSGTGWENVCYSNSTGNSVTSYQYEAHSPISNSYTLPAGATRIRAIAYDQNDTMLWTSFSWIDSSDYHFASTSPEDGYYDDWFDIPTGAVKVNFGVRHSKLNTTTAMSLNDIKSVDITVQTVSEIEVDVWNGGTGWLNGDYTSGNSDSFETSWHYTYHYNYQQYIEVPEGATHVMVKGISNENDSHFEGGGINAFDSNHHHVHWWGCAWEWHEISSDTVYVQPNVKWNNDNTRTISSSDVKSVTLVWKLPALEINQSINVNYGNGLTVNQNNELEVNIGTGLEFDQTTGAINVTGGTGGDTVEAGDGIDITTDSQTGNKVISIDTGNGLQINQDGEVEIDPSIIPEVIDYEAGNGIEITEVTHEDEFRVQNQEYFFDTHGLTCGLNARVWTTVNDGDILAAMCIHNNGGNQVPLFVGLTEDSVKVSQNYDSNILGPNGSFDYHGKTWYFTADYALSGTDGQDTQGHIQTLPTTYSFNSTPSNFVPAAKDLIDLAVLLSDLEYPTISVKYNKGLTVNQDNELEVNIGTGLEFDQVTGAINVTGGSGGDTVEAGDGIDIDTDSQTGNKVISTIVQENGGLTIDEDTNGLKLSPSAAGKAINISDEITFDSWNNGTGWANEEYYDNTSNTHIPWGQNLMIYPTSTDVLFRIPDGVTQAKCSATSVSPSIALKTGLYFYNEQGVHFAGPTRSTDPDTIIDIPAGSVYVNQSIRNVNDSNIFSSNVAGATITWVTGGTKIDVKYGTGLMLNQDNELEVNIGDGLEIDPDTGAINVTGGGGGGDTIAEGDGITITTDSQTGVKTIGVNVGSGLEIDPNTGTLNVTGSSGGGSGNYSAGEAIDIRQSILTNNIDAIRWDISEIKTNGGAWTQVRYVEFCDSSGTAQILSTGSGIWEDNTAVTYSHDPAGGGSQEITDMIANTRKMCAAWRGPGHTLKLTFILDTATAPSNIVKFRMKTGDDEVGRDPKAWKIYVRDSVTQRWYLVHETENAEVTNNRSTWSNYYNFSTPSDTSINVKYGTGLSVDPITNELFVDGQLPEGTIIKKLTYTGTGSTTNSNIHFTKKPLAILSLHGFGGTNYLSSIPTPIDSPWMSIGLAGNSASSIGKAQMSYDDTTNTLTLYGADTGWAFNVSGATYTMYYLIKGHTGSGTSVNNEVSVVKTFTYVGTGTATNNIQFPETPDMVLSIYGPLGTGGAEIRTLAIDTTYPSANSEYFYEYWQNGSGFMRAGTYSFNDTTNILSLVGPDYGASLNYSGLTYIVRYIVNETISSGGGGSGSYEPGTAIEFSNQQRKINPVMTSDVLPYGEVIESGYFSTRYGWNAFDGTDSQTWSSHAWSDGTNQLDDDPESCYVGYVFPEDVYLTEFVLSTYSDRTYTGIIQVRSEGIWTTVVPNVSVVNTGYIKNTYTLQTPVLCDAFRFCVLSGAEQYFVSASPPYGGNVCDFQAIGYPTGASAISVKYGDGLTVNQDNELEVNLGSGLQFDANGAIEVTGGGGGSGDTVAEGDGISITTDQQTGDKVIAVNAGTGLQVDQTTNELEIDDSVVTEDDELTLVFVPDDYQPS